MKLSQQNKGAPSFPSMDQIMARAMATTVMATTVLFMGCTSPGTHDPVSTPSLSSSRTTTSPRPQDPVSTPSNRSSMTTTSPHSPGTGKTAVVIDTDGDGIPDDQDKCPAHPEDRDGFQDEDGCPDPDNDNDGIPDVNDKCPNVPEDGKGPDKNDGCPLRIRVRTAGVPVRVHHP